MTPALHGSMLPDGSYGGMPGGYLLSVAGRQIYVAGDTALFSDMALIGRVGLDMAVLPIGDNFTMGPEDALLAVDFLRATTVVPCHYNTWPYIEVDVEGWVARVNAETNSTARLMGVDESFTL
jgi:L-ascorbate metabolism protein UlaG (beta-lactamase superfamily)